MFLLYFMDSSIDIDRVPLEVVAVSFHLGADPMCGHYRTALSDGDHWFMLDDAAPPVVSTSLPDMVQRNCCLLWLTSQHGGAVMGDDDPPPSAAGSLALLSRDQMIR